MHDVPAHEALVLLESERGHGLTASAVDVRLRRFGPNALPKAHGRSALRRLAAQFNHPLIYILLVAAGVAAAVGETVDASVILGVVVVNAVIGFLQEGRAENALEALAEMVVGEVSVLRDGRRSARGVMSDGRRFGDRPIADTGSRLCEVLGCTDAEAGARSDTNCRIDEITPPSYSAAPAPTR